MNIIRKMFKKDTTEDSETMNKDAEHNVMNKENKIQDDNTITMKKKDEHEQQQEQPHHHPQQPPMIGEGQMGPAASGGAGAGAGAPPPRVDRSSIDPTKVRDCLNHHLDAKLKQRRKSDSDLAAVLQGPAHELQMAQAKDHLSQLMRKREDRHSLVEQGILMDEKCIAGPIQSNAKELERNMICDKLEQELQHRPAKEELEKTGVIKEGLEEARCSLEQEQKKIQLKRKLSDRPTPEELQKQHILEPMDDVHNVNASAGEPQIKTQMSTKKKHKKGK